MNQYISPWNGMFYKADVFSVTVILSEELPGNQQYERIWFKFVEETKGRRDIGYCEADYNTDCAKPKALDLGTSGY